MKLFLFLWLFSSSLLFGTPSCPTDDFEVLMGKETAHWRHVIQNRDIDLLQAAKQLYLKNKEAQFLENRPYKIPPVIHFIWLGPRPFPPQSVENIRTWIAHHPDWTVKFWTDRDRDPPCEGMKTVLIKDFSFTRLKECYEDSQNWGEKSDILRFEILFQEGGVYVDHDANCLRPFEGMHRGYDFFCCLETPHEAFVGRNITCGIGVLGSRAGHPTVNQIIDLVKQRWEPLKNRYRGRDEYSRTEIVMQRTYIALTHALEETIDRNGNVDIILPAAYFFSKTGIPSLYSKHFYTTVWDESKQRRSDSEKSLEKGLSKILQKTQNLKLLLIGLICLNGVYILWHFLKKRKTS